MKSLVSGLLVICVLISSTDPSLSVEDESILRTTVDESHLQDGETKFKLSDSSEPKQEGQVPEGRSLTQEEMDKKSKPLRSIFMGIYKNYKSTYLGNKTLTEYKQHLREKMKNKQQQLEENESIRDNGDNDDDDEIEFEGEDEMEEDGDKNIELSTTTAEDKGEEYDNLAVVTDQPESYYDNPASEKERNTPPSLSMDKRKPHLASSDTPELQYNVGPALNMSLDLDNSIVKVNLDGESLKELVTGRWLSDNSEEGRGKKYEMVTRILPLFIIPFLIQSAIVPFLVTKLKLLLMKSMLVGKLAIFLLIISAFRNSNKPMQTYEVAPSYWAGEPSRRSEIAAAASSNMAYNGYRVEGKPAAWVN
ncbi:osiris 22 [Musca autumnalis]|uniref:osiris 22 n=1 Tax=Musca autumnalis TaxID=221902 RepID=UPI003CEEE4C5